MFWSFFFYIKDFFEAFLLTVRRFGYFWLSLLLIQWGSDDQTLDIFRKPLIKHKTASNSLGYCASSYFDFAVSWRITHGLMSEWQTWWVGISRVEYSLGGNYIRQKFLYWNNQGGDFFWVVIILGENCPGENCPSGSYSGWKFLWWKFSWWEFSDWNHPGDSFQGRSFYFPNKQTQKLAILLLFIYVYKYLTALYFQPLIQILCALCSIPFENTHLFSCYFYCVDIVLDQHYILWISNSHKFYDQKNFDWNVVLEWLNVDLACICTCIV